MGMFRDDRASAERRFKAVGTACFGSDGVSDCLHGTAVSSDGIYGWSDTTEINWPAPQRWDDHQNLFFDEVTGRYVLTTRDGFGGDPGRTIAVALGAEDGSFGGWETPVLTLQGNAAHQLYSQITWRYYN